MTPPAISPQLLRALEAVDNSEEMELFLQDLLTPQEITALNERWAIVDALLRKDKAQREIAAELNVAIATITRGSRQLQTGTGMFGRIWERLQ